jgi:hypothetical protein
VEREVGEVRENRKRRKEELEYEGVWRREDGEEK